MHGGISCHAGNCEIPSQLRDAAADLPERWWFAADVNDVLAKRLGRREPKKHMQARRPLPGNCYISCVWRVCACRRHMQSPCLGLAMCFTQLVVVLLGSSALQFDCSYKQHEQAACTCSGVLWSQRAGVEALDAKGLTTGLLAAGAGGPVPALGHGAAGAGDRGCWAQPHLPRAQRRALAAQLRGAYHADLSGRAGAAAACGCMCRVKAQKCAHDGS